MTNPTIPFTQNDYEILKREELFSGFFRVGRYHIRQRKFNGEWTQIFTRDVAERKAAVAILPYDPILDCVVLIEQFRAGALSNPESPWLIEIIAGLIENSDGTEEVAKREAKEEADCDILDIYKIYHYFVSPGGSNETLTLFVGRVDAANIGGVYGLTKEHEDIRAFTLSTEEAFAMVQENKILTSPAILSLQWLQLNKEWLKQLWQTK